MAYAILVIAVAVSLYAVKSNSDQNARLVERNRALDQRQNRELRLLCDRGYIIDDLILGAIALVNQPPNSPEDTMFTERYERLHLDLLDQLTNPESPCVPPSR